MCKGSNSKNLSERSIYRAIHNASRIRAETRPRSSAEPSGNPRNQAKGRTSATRARPLRDEEKSCGQTREYQNDQTSHNRSRLCLYPGESNKLTTPSTQGAGESFSLDNCQPYQNLFLLTTVSHIGFPL